MRSFEPIHRNDARANHMVAQFRDVTGGVHIADTSSSVPAIPRQLPPSPRHFTNREGELDRLSRTQQRIRDHQRRELAVLCGQGGVGKTALATHVLAGAADDFGDGQLYADLRGFSTGRPCDPHAVLEGFLQSLGIAPEAIPSDLSARAALFRSHTHGKRIAVLLDNAHSAAQVRCLLPGDGPHLVLVTTRLHLGGLLADGAHFLDLAPLDPADATALADLARLCAGLPLALTVAAAPLLLHPHTSLSATIQRLTTQRLHALSAPDEEGLSVTATFDTSYAALSEPAARLYRRAGLHPGADFAPAAAAALADMALPEAELAITELLTAHMLETPTPGRYRLHDLARDHAQATAHHHDSGSERDRAVERMLEHYLTHTAAADLVLNPHRFRLALAAFDAAAQAAPFDNQQDALTWMEAELATLAALVRLCHETGRHATCWRLCEAMRATFMLTKHYDTWESCCGMGLASAQTIEDPEAEAFMRLMVGSHLLQAKRDTEAAMGHHLQALRLWRSVGHRQGQASALARQSYFVVL